MSFDNHKKSMVAPDWEPIGKGRFYFYRAGSVEHAVQQFWTEHDGRDHSMRLQKADEGPKPPDKLTLRCYKDWRSYELQMTISLRAVVDRRTARG